ncbi:MAG: hypothetical protein JNL83_06210 [Myxococcales bacterium]|nr:hypothetical protein [Myxococcales bacterium]
MQELAIMKVATLVAMLAIAASSTAGNAQPREERGGRVPYGPNWRPRPPAAAPRAGWVTLATPTPTRHGTEWIFLDDSTGPLRVLRIQATSGTVHLKQVRVDLASGKVLTFSADRWLDRRRPNTRIDLGALHYVDRITITTARRPVGSYVVYGAAIVPRDDLVAQR